MAPLAARCVLGWNERRRKGVDVGLVAVSFDMANHGSRLVDQKANLAWREGNERHAVDMWECYHSALPLIRDVLLPSLPSTLFPSPSTHRLTTHHALGVSLGGHAAWHLALHLAPMRSAAILIGSPDFSALMRQRAEKSRRPAWVAGRGRAWLGGSEDFPAALAADVARWDPAALVLGTGDDRDRDALGPDRVARRLREVLGPCLSGKRVLCLSGAADKLVPYERGKRFLDALKEAVGDEGGWWNREREEERVVFRDVVFEGVGHEVTAEMMGEALKFVWEGLEKEGVDEGAERRGSKM
ncbi:hypothetical protein BDY21DRAFT_340816 [Lineolata rhizophorae]|uniref:Alpha/Beta hydrolase protein n=1 Tax=Lineolata rhizophorae TaxID=578093 RepID=A0A6A6P475_9PEZI|nr:hypothetical protein BDY21DRAFT_340816 [Lineolata rhizophorae]